MDLSKKVNLVFNIATHSFPLGGKHGGVVGELEEVTNKSFLGFKILFFQSVSLQHKHTKT